MKEVFLLLLVGLNPGSLGYSIGLRRDTNLHFGVRMLAVTLSVYFCFSRMLLVVITEIAVSAQSGWYECEEAFTLSRSEPTSRLARIGPRQEGSLGEKALGMASFVPKQRHPFDFETVYRCPGNA